METGWGWDQKSLISELLQGMELTKQLRAELNVAASAAENRQLLVQGIISSYEKALLIMNFNQPHMAESATFGLPESPLSANGSPSSDDSSRGLSKEGSKKRKAQPRWTEQVRVNSETRFEGPHEDGYSWRKYGQKDILGAKHPRSYYRCTFRNTQNCWAIKQVQRSDEDPSVFEITYRGKHTCSQGNYLVQSLLSPERQDKKPKNNCDNGQDQKQTSKENLLSYQTVQNIENREAKKASTFGFASNSLGCKDIKDVGFSHLAIDTAETTLGSFSQSFISPTTPESSYFVPSPCQMSNMEGAQNAHRSESDINDIFSVNTSATNSPILDWDFPLDSQHINPNFSFDSPGFFY